jgi:hypothetical protein
MLAVSNAAIGGKEEKSSFILTGKRIKFGQRLLPNERVHEGNPWAKGRGRRRRKEAAVHLTRQYAKTPLLLAV